MPRTVTTLISWEFSAMKHTPNANAVKEEGFHAQDT
jgi:hypothetical protein